MINLVILLLLLIAGEGHLKLILYLLEFIFPIFLFLGIVALGVIISPIISSLKNTILKSRNNSTIARKSLFQQHFFGILASTFIICMFIGVTIIPVAVNPSSIMPEDIPEKPIIIAHRGAAHISPENTLESIHLSHEIGADGWEVDVRISFDGFFFLMHDSDLKRTTDVESVYPERANEEASSFTIAELQQLNAGSWFVDRDPYGTIRSGRIDTETASSYNEVKIPLLDDIISYTVENPHLIDIDMKRPPTGHPYASQYEDLLLEKLNLSNLTENVIIKSYKPAAANFTHLLSPGEYSIEEMIGIGAELIDEKYWVPNRKIGEYGEANMPVMVGVLNSPIRFSQVWLLGVHMVLTDDPDVFINMSLPLRIMKRNLYFPLWVAASLISYCGGLTYYILREKRRKNVIKYD
ncbi:MAG: glycerophosphodiester phosphodiesterase family protein [Promethearchaeota archaeon]